jgi:hypothetical protein
MNPKPFAAFPVAKPLLGAQTFCLLPPSLPACVFQASNLHRTRLGRRKGASSPQPSPPKEERENGPIAPLMDLFATPVQAPLSSSGGEGLGERRHSQGYLGELWGNGAISKSLAPVFSRLLARNQTRLIS